MEKSELAYHEAVRKLDAAVKTARTKHNVKIEELEAAKRRLDALPPSRDALQDARRRIAQAELDQIIDNERKPEPKPNL